MFKEVGSYGAKTKLPEILRRVESGESFTITNRGKPTADLIPSRTSNKLKTDAAIQNILKRKKHILSDSVFNSLKDTSRK